VSAEVSYIHRTFHGFMRTDLLGREVTDYVAYTITAPTDDRLPGGGGYPITVHVNASSAPTQNNLRREQNVSIDGKERQAYYDGVNFNVNARMRNGLFVSLGTQTGRRVDDDCNVVINFDNPNTRGCHDADPWQTTIRGLGSYTIPKIDVLVSATLRSQTPLELGADWVVANSTIRTLLPPGSPVPPGLTSGNSTIDLTDPDHRIFAGNRRTQMDMRFAKVLRLGRTRTDVGVDLWNLFNTNYATAYEGNYGPVGSTWQNPTSVYAPRFVRLNFTVGF
jgi:hypothetical protein